MKKLLIFIALFTLSFSFGQEKPNETLVFIGSKISLKKVKVDRSLKTVIDTVIVGNDTVYNKSTLIPVDEKFIATYHVKEVLRGSYDGDTIEFVVYDHYGRPGFSKFKNVMLFVSEYKGTYYHQKYRFFDVYKTTDNRWAGSYSAGYYEMLEGQTALKPEKIDFKRKVSYRIKEPQYEAEKYPSPFYQVSGNRAHAIYGNYVDDLIKLKSEVDKELQRRLDAANNSQ